MIRLPYKLLAKTTTFVMLFVLTFLVSPAKASAASAWINPGTGRIWLPQFKVSVMVSSYDSEPEMSGSTISITHSSNVKVVSIEEGDFDTYLKKDFNSETNKIEIQAVNQSGTYKTGDVKLASITFEPLSKTGNVQLTINSESVISGAGGEQLLTETVNGVYTLDIQDQTSTTGTGTNGGTGTSTTTTTTTGTNVTETTTGAQIQTGINDSLSKYLLISVGLIALGLVLGGVLNDNKAA